VCRPGILPSPLPAVWAKAESFGASAIKHRRALGATSHKWTSLQIDRMQLLRCTVSVSCDGSVIQPMNPPVRPACSDNLGSPTTSPPTAWRLRRWTEWEERSVRGRREQGGHVVAATRCSLSLMQGAKGARGRFESDARITTPYGPLNCAIAVPSGS